MEGGLQEGNDHGSPNDHLNDSQLNYSQDGIDSRQKSLAEVKKRRKE